MNKTSQIIEDFFKKRDYRISTNGWLASFFCLGWKKTRQELWRLAREIEQNQKGEKMKALVVIDVQNDFILKRGKLPVPGAVDIVETIRYCIEKVRE